MNALQQTPDSPSLPAGITPGDAERIMSYAAADLSEETRRIYALQWDAFTAWCADRGADPLPAGVETVAAYLSERAPERSTSWITQAAAAIRKAHERAGLDSPTAKAGLRRTLKGIRRKHGRPAQPKKAARTVDIRAMVGAIEQPEPGEGAGVAAQSAYVRSLRDRALLLVGYAAALRRSELAAVRVADVAFNSEGMEISIARSKSDQEGKGATVGVAYGEALCPVRALRRWMDAAGIESGPIFRAVPPHGYIKRDSKATPVSGRTVRNVVQKAAEAAGLPAGEYAGHSLRRGHITEGAINGAPLARLQMQARHADPRTTAGYIEAAERMKTTTSRDLGL